jgi:hypothetical protein
MPLRVLGLPDGVVGRAAVGCVKSLIERERRIGRSLSIAGGGIGDESRKSRVLGWAWASFRRPAGGRVLEVEDREDAAALTLSSYVLATAAKAAAKAGGRECGAGSCPARSRRCGTASRAPAPEAIAGRECGEIAGA